MAEAGVTTATQPWFDVDRGVLDRRIFTDPDVYQQELQRIFGRGWNFICHESQLKDAGSFFMTYIGEDEVIAVRDREGRVQVLLNSCPHRGNTVCRAELGRTKSFFCSYHGWNFDLDGRLIGMPNEQEFYRNPIDKEQWGLGKAAQVESYRGFVFATMDPAAPVLTNYLGWVGRLGIDMMASQGELEVLDGIQKNRLRCNWKLAVDNLYDWYHVKVSHGTVMRVGFLTEESMAPMDQMVILGEYGHGIGGPGISVEQQAEFDEIVRTVDPADLPKPIPGARSDFPWFVPPAMRRNDPKMRAELGPVGSRSFGHPNIFPNLWVALTNQVCLRIPRGPLETELWWFTIVPKDQTDEERRMSIYMANHAFGPAGLLEQDDGENWSHSTRGAKGTQTRTMPLNYTMGIGQDKVSADNSGQASIETVVNEHGQRWTYQCWQEWMLADSWQDLRANHSLPPTAEV